MFGLGSYFTVANGVVAWRPASMAAPWRVFRGARALVPAAIGGLAMLALLSRLAGDPSAGGVLALWVVAIVAFAVPFAGRVGWLSVPLLRGLLPDIAAVALLVAIFVALNVQDLGDWYYSAIGDEYAFYSGATRVLEEGIARPFNQDGVYGHHPVLNSVYQALVMTVFGEDNFGWRFASVLSVAVAIPGIYVIGLTLGDRRVAVVAAIFFAFSHYLIAYAHTGYNTIHSLAPAIWTLAFFILGLRRGSPMLLYVAGAIAGLGFYTHFGGRAALPIMALFVLVQPEWRRRLPELWPLGLGFATVAAPMFVVNKGEVLSVMLSQIAGGYAEEITGPVGQRLFSNISKNLPTINYNPDSFHYVSGPLMDPLTAFFATLGVGLALGRIRDPSNRLLLIWLVVAFAITGLLTPYPQVAISRLNSIVPPLVLLGGCAAVQLWGRLPAYRGTSRRVWAGMVLLVGLALVVLGLNVRQFWFETPRSFHLTREAVAIGAMRSDDCGGDVQRTVFAGRHTEPLLRPALTSYYPEAGELRLLDYEGVEAGLPSIGLSARCVIFLNPDETGAGEVMDALARRYPGGTANQLFRPLGQDRRRDICAEGRLICLWADALSRTPEQAYRVPPSLRADRGRRRFLETVTGVPIHRVVRGRVAQNRTTNVDGTAAYELVYSPNGDDRRCLSSARAVTMRTVMWPPTVVAAAVRCHDGRPVPRVASTIPSASGTATPAAPGWASRSYRD